MAFDCAINDDLVCTRCGRPVPIAGVRRNCQAAGLGDMVAAGLAAVGITKARVAAAMGVEDCGCAGRQEALNELGRMLGIGITQSGESLDQPAGGS